VREHLVEMLSEMNYAVLTAENAEAAVDLIADPSRKVNLLLTHVVMPGMNGRQLVDRALAERPGIHVLFLTGYAREKIVHEGRLD
jgi:CheY-like chemotaxis protein